jgi:NADH-quinone oxidoreductase subunit J
MPFVHPALLAATIPDALTFAIAAIICVGGAGGVVLLRNPVHAALSLVATLFGIAVLFVEEDAQFLAAVQVIVYAGAIVVLFLFVIMLLGVDRQEAIFQDRLKYQRSVGAVAGVAVLVEVLLLAKSKWPTGVPSVSGKLSGQSGNVQDLGKSIFTTYLLPFEVTSALLVIAVIGAVALVRRPPRRDGGEAGEDGAPAMAPALDEPGDPGSDLPQGPGTGSGEAVGAGVAAGAGESPGGGTEGEA